MKTKINSILCILTIFILLYFNSVTAKGCLGGINLCLKAVIPSMFPLIIVTSYITIKNYSIHISKILYPLFKFVFHCPRRFSYPIFVGLICGCPISAKTINELTCQKVISQRESQILCTFCCNCSLSFVINYAYNIIFINEYSLQKYLIYVYIPIILTGIINLSLFKFDNDDFAQNPPCQTGNLLEISLKTMGIICGYVILFSIIISILSNFITNQNFIIPMTNFFEITTGLSLSQNYPKKILLFFIIWSGLSILLQSFTFLNKQQRKYYILGKMEQGLILFILLFFV